MSAAAVDAAARMLAERAGLRVEASARSRLARALRAGNGATDLQRLIDLVTVQESGFFRHPEHFDLIAAHVRDAHPAAIWSAGCADGQEAWSLAMLLEEQRADGWTVVASDVSAAALQRAREGRYPERRLAGLSEQRRRRFLRPGGDGSWEIVPQLRSRVRFVQHNLATDPPPPGTGAIVLCRNVLIYLVPAAAQGLLTLLHERMPPDGLLLIGAAEALLPGEAPFVAERHGSVYAYRPRHVARPGGAGAAPIRPVVPQASPPGPDELAAEGERLAAADAHAEAAEAFRKVVYLQPSDPLAHLRLALALERAGDAAGAARAFRAARAAIERSGLHVVDGWSGADVRRLVDAKLGDPA